MRRLHGSAIVSIALLLGLVLLESARAEDKVEIVTEEFPPYSYTDKGKIVGLSTEVVRAVLNEIGMKGEITSLPWARAYDLALHSRNVLIYSITRTPERETQFKWVGVIAPSEWYMFSRHDRGLRLSSLDEAKTFQIGTVNQDVGEQYLVTKGFQVGKNLQSISSNRLNFEKLQNGRIDLWISNGLVATYLSREYGHTSDKPLEVAYRIPDLGTEGTYMAFGPATSDAYVALFSAGLEQIKKKGIYSRLCNDWVK